MAITKNFKFAYFGLFILFLIVQVSSSLNLGLISGDLKKSSSPLIIKKTSHHSPITINIRPQTLNPPVLPPIPLWKTPLKTKIEKPKKRSLHTTILPTLPKLPKLLMLPKLPKLPPLPLIPPLLPLLPPLPLLPLPKLPILPPILPRIPKPKKPIRVPIVGKTKLKKTLGTGMKPPKLPTPKPKLKKTILDKLLKLKKDGSLTTQQFLRFKKLLL